MTPAGEPPQPSRPDLTLFKTLHRSGDGFIAFSSRQNRSWPVVATPIERLDELPADAIAALARDGFGMINTTRTGGNRRSGFGEGFPRGNRRTAAVHALNAVYCDLDTHTKGIDVGDAVAEVIRLQDRGELPNASVFVRSGRGLWVFWLLVDRTTGKPPLSTGDTLRRHATIQRHLADRLAGLGADRAMVTNAVAHVRVPGSINTKSQNPVTYWTQLDPAGREYVYSLDELSAWFGTGQATGRRGRPRGSGEKTGGKRTDWGEINAKRLNAFRQLETLRGGFREGDRNNAALILATLLRQSQRPRREIEVEVSALADRCSPPLTSDEVRGAVQGARYQFRTATILQRLNVTERESELVGWSKPAKGSPFVVKPEGAGSAGVRREEILKLIEAGGGELPSERRMVSMLQTRGFKVSKTTVRNDLQVLGLGGVRVGSNPLLNTPHQHPDSDPAQ